MAGDRARTHAAQMSAALVQQFKLATGTDDVPNAHRQSLRTLQECLRRTADRPEALRMAYREHGITMTAMAKELRLSVSRISRLIAVAELAGRRMEARGKT